MPQHPDAPPPPSLPAHRVAWRGGAAEHGSREVAEETAVAFSFNRTTHAVMMATPADLEDFAVGFSLSEGIVDGAAGIEELEVVSAPQGVELRMWIDAGRMAALDARRRRMAGPTGCGLCGLDSLAQAMRPADRVDSAFRVSARELQEAVALLGPAQALNHRTRAVHAAGFVRPGAGLALLREDVGRHNALDKLAGAVARAGLDASAGLAVMTSRVSVELVQKAARMGVPVLAAVSAPTALAIRMAEAAGLTLVGIARADGFEVFTHPERVRT